VGADTVLDYTVAEMGSNMSQGQKQLLHVTRALLRRCPVLILDEVTAYLDTGTEKYLYSALMAHATNATILIVCHRTEHLTHVCDTSIHLNDGRVTLVDLPSTNN
jgi:ABC-type transport system involved in cytochrome bd biosynthesis fused ATPase/permease subunit